MIQFLRYGNPDIEKEVFLIPAGKEAVTFFAKRAMYLLLFIYGTLFLAVAIPFVETPFIPIYFIGSMATAFYIIRFINHIIKFTRYQNGSITATKTELVISAKSEKYTIARDDMKYLECNILGNLIVREKNDKISFPLMLLKQDDRDRLIALFEDMAPKRTRVFKKIWEFIDAIVVALFLAVHIIQFIVQAYFIPTGSMEDTLLVGDHLFVEKITYGPIIPQMIGMSKPVHLNFLGIREVQRGDIVIFRPPHEKDKDYIKRCIAVPGDKYEIKDGSVFLNDKRTVEPYVKGSTFYYFGGKGKNEIEGVVPEGKIIVMGDNRENSQDSRSFGYLEIERIKGRAFILYWNADQVLGSFNLSRLGLIR